MLILIDNGHGKDTPGKQSPDRRLKEYAYTREIARLVVNELKGKGYNAELLVTEETDVPLAERCRRANSHNANDTILVSIHCNAAGAGTQWLNARGWSVFVSNNASKNSKKLATCLADAAKNNGLSVRYQQPNIGYWVQNLAICRDTKCPAVLTENLFMDNREDVEYLLSDEGKRTIAKIHTDSITKYINTI